MEDNRGKGNATRAPPVKAPRRKVRRFIALVMGVLPLSLRALVNPTTNEINFDDRERTRGRHLVATATGASMGALDLVEEIALTGVPWADMGHLREIIARR